MNTKFVAAVVGALIALPAYSQTPTSFSMRIKDGVKLKGVHAALTTSFPAIDDVWRVCEVDAPVITSGVDALDVHRTGSWHAVGRAVDIRGRSHTPAQVACIKNELPGRLPQDFSAEGSYVLIWETPQTHRTNSPHWHLAFVEHAQIVKVKAGN